MSAAHQTNANYRIFDKSGNELSTEALVDRLGRADIVLFGELHGNPTVHRLQREITEKLFAAKMRALVLGAEMFEADNQLILDEYLAGLILHKHLLAEAKVWSGYERDYKPLVDFAREQGLRFIATNIPRRYANLVARQGLEALEELPRAAMVFMAPLPITVDLGTPGYRQMLEMNQGMGHGMQMQPMHFVAAQAVKDATMAHFILKNHPADSLSLHFNGDYHSRQYGGIYWHLKQANSSLSVLTISTRAAMDLNYRKEYAALGDFILAVPET